MGLVEVIPFGTNICPIRKDRDPSLFFCCFFFVVVVGNYRKLFVSKFYRTNVEILIQFTKVGFI